jgi:hypothetical protein
VNPHFGSISVSPVAVAALLILLSVVAISILVTRIATRAFMLTGLSRDAARFQARSIITGTGFTTDEADHIVNHPVRRRIALTLMLIGNAGLDGRLHVRPLVYEHGHGRGGAPAGPRPGRGARRAGLPCSQRPGGPLPLVAHRGGTESGGGFQVRDMHTILNLGGGYMVTRMEVDPESWLAGETLQTINLLAEGLIVLAIERPDGTMDYAPGADDCVLADGCVIVYGPEERIAQLCDQLQCNFDPTEATDPT